MLTIDMLKQNQSLSGLTDVQLSAIAEMSKNDENAVIGTKIGSLHGQYDADIFGITGIQKNSGEKSYDYAKRVLNEYKTQLTNTATVQAQLAKAKQEVDTLKQKLADGSGDDAVKQQLKDAKAQVNQLQMSLTEKDAAIAKAKQEYEAAIKNVHVDYAFNSAVSGMKFKAGISEGIQKILLESAKAEVLKKGTPDIIDGKVVFRGSDGNILNNPNNNLNPYTVEELVMQTSIKDAVDSGKKQTGGGTGPNKPDKTNITTVDLSGVKSQIEADKVIESYLLSNGYTRDSQDFYTKLLEIRNENEVSKLPIR